jgi:hypothetical protein
MDWWLYNITMYGDFRDGLLLLEPQHHISMYIMYKSHEIVLLVNDVFLKTCAYIFCCLEVSNYWFQVVNTYVYPGVDCHSRIGIIIKPLNEFTEGGACPFAVLEMQKKHEKTCSTHWIPQAFFGALAYTHWCAVGWLPKARDFKGVNAARLRVKPCYTKVSRWLNPPCCWWWWWYCLLLLLL